MTGVDLWGCCIGMGCVVTFYTTLVSISSRPAPGSGPRTVIDIIQAGHISYIKTFHTSTCLKRKHNKIEKHFFPDKSSCYQNQNNTEVGEALVLSCFSYFVSFRGGGGGGRVYLLFFFSNFASKCHLNVNSKYFAFSPFFLSHHYPLSHY